MPNSIPTSWLYILTVCIIIILLFWEFFTSALADGFPLESERQQVSTSLGDSSQYSGRSQQYSSLDGLHSSSYFQLLQSLQQSFGDCTERTNYNWYHRHFHIPQFFQFSIKIYYYYYYLLL